MVSVAAAAAVVASSTSMLAAPGANVPAAEEQSGCYTGDATLTVEEQRLTLAIRANGTPVATRFLEASGFDRLVDGFERRLCEADSVQAAERVAENHGARLWRAAVQRAQGERSIGRIDRYDDRPLYWARLHHTRALRQWEPTFEVSSLQRGALVHILDYASRGIGSDGFRGGSDATRVLASGFDTYSLDDSLRNSNPSGAVALQLDGVRDETADGVVVYETVMLPVNWTDVDQGIVEDAFGPALVSGQHRASLIMTISQTGRGRMDIEEWAANFRGGSPDNNRVMQYGPISRASHWPQPFDSPEWIRTTLPYEAMIAADTEPWPVQLNDGICEWPAGTYPDPTEIRCPDDPSPGSHAAEGPGGNYLSNESMYRSNRLRIGAGAWGVPGGHLHISALDYPDDPNRLTSRPFERDRRAIVDQTVELVEAAAEAVQRRQPRVP